VEEMNRMKGDLELVNQELHGTKVALQDLDTKHQTQTIKLQAYIDRYGILDSLKPVKMIDALVEDVDHDLKAVVLNVGENDGVQEATDFHIYRHNEYVGKVRVSKLYPELCGAKILFESSDGKKIQRGDEATTRFN
jgi:hypothetical protein